MWRNDDALPSRAAAVALFPALLLIAGCDRTPTEEDHGEPVGVLLYVAGELGPFAVFADGGWEGAFPGLTVGETIEVEGVFVDGEGGEIPLGDEYTIGGVITGTPGVATVTSLGDRLEVEGVGEGSVSLVVQLEHGGHADLATSGLPLTVTAP